MSVHRKNSGSPHLDQEKGHVHDPTRADLEDAGHSHSLHRGLQARQITMIALGGAVGTGLIIGTGTALTKAGPGSIMVSYTIVGFLVFLVMAGLGEMATHLPMASGFTGYATRFCDESLGFATGWTYWFKYIIVTPNQLTAAALVIQYWVPREKVNPGVWVAIFLVVIVCINYFGIRFFGEFEFWLSSIKVVTIVGLILLCFILAMGGGPDHDRKGFRYWKNPGAFKEWENTKQGIKIEGDAGRFVALWSTFVTATFAYLGTELVGVTVGEAENPRRNVPRAIKLTFYRILFFYCLSVLLLGMNVAYNDPNLLSATTKSNSANASPFVVAIISAGIPGLPDVMNGAILIFVFSASNSDLYIASRTIFGLAVEGKAPAILARTDKRGVPIYALGLSSLFALLAFMNVSSDSKVVFGYFVNLVSMFGLLTWISILVTHIYFCNARVAQGMTNDSMVYVAPFGKWGSVGALAFCILIAFTKNFEVFIGKFDVKNFITGYLGIPLYLCLIFGHKLIAKPKTFGPAEADLFSGKAEIDEEENKFLEDQAAKRAAGPSSKREAFYNRYISWLF